MMRPRDRVAQIINGRKPDKLPIVVSTSNSFLCNYYSISIEDYLTDADLCAETHKEFISEFTIDYSIVATGYILYGCGPELGVQWKFVGDNFPGVVESPIQSESDLKLINIPEEPTGYFKHYLEVIKKVNDSLGEIYHLSASILGPFASACFLRGTENVLVDTIINLDFYKEYMARCTELSVYFGKNVLATGISNPFLNEVFLGPGMIKPDTYHNLIAPYAFEVQNQLGSENAPNSMGAFMGRPGNLESQKAGSALYHTFWGDRESVEVIKKAVRYRMPGWPFPVSVSGRALNGWDLEKTLSFIKESVDFLVIEEGIYPSINLMAVLADSHEAASDMAEKLEAIISFRDKYQL